MTETIERVIHERDLLASAIANAVLKAKIYNGEIELTGPHLLMMLDDMAEIILLLDKDLKTSEDRNEKLINDLMIKEFGKDETMFRALEAIIERSYNDPLGTSKVIDMRKIAERALKEVQ